MSGEARWPGNFRDLSASVTRMATFSPKGRIDSTVAATEVARLKRTWSDAAQPGDGLEALLDAEALTAIDPFDRVQLAYVVEVCRTGRSLSDVGRKLFAASRTKRASTNDADRLRKYLVRFGVTWDMLADG